MSTTASSATARAKPGLLDIYRLRIAMDVDANSGGTPPLLSSLGRSESARAVMSTRAMERGEAADVRRSPPES
jgi:hypothetical protein